MSATVSPSRPATSRALPLGAEIRRQLSRRRTVVVFVVLVALPLVLVAAFAVSVLARGAVQLRRGRRRTPTPALAGAAVLAVLGVLAVGPASRSTPPASSTARSVEAGTVCACRACSDSKDSSGWSNSGS